MKNSSKHMNEVETMSYLSSGQIRIILKPADKRIKTSPIVINEPNVLKLEAKINDHVRLRFQKTIGFNIDNVKDQRLRYLELMETKTLVTVELPGSVVFQGIVTHFNIKLDRTIVNKK
jgi:hypothetical protein